MSLVLHPEMPPIREDETGAMRIGESRVLLEILVHAFQGGARPERILDMYPTVTLADVYSVIGYYLRNQEAVDAYLEERQRQADVIQARIEAQQGDLKELRERLLRAKNQRNDSSLDSENGEASTVSPSALDDSTFLTGDTRRGSISMPQDTPSIFDLSPAEKLQLVEDLWDDLAATPETVPVHDWQIKELERRRANLRANPGSGLSWEEVKRRVREINGR